MAHAYHHARSSARHFGGTPDDYLIFHEFMDHTKEHLADSRHRLFLHNAQGIFLVERVFGSTFLRASDGKRMALRPVLEQHVTEDFGGRLPSLPDCFRHPSKRPLYSKDDTIMHCQLSAQTFGGLPSDYLILHEEMNQVRKVLPDELGLCVLHNAWGISLIERIIGPTLTRPSDEIVISTRQILEMHVTSDLGYIPTMQESIEHVELEGWMYRNARPLSRSKDLIGIV